MLLLKDADMKPSVCQSLLLPYTFNEGFIKGSASFSCEWLQTAVVTLEWECGGSGLRKAHSLETLMSVLNLVPLHQLDIQIFYWISTNFYPQQSMYQDVYICFKFLLFHQITGETSHLKVQMSTSWRCQRKSQGITKVSRIDPPWTMTAIYPVFVEIFQFGAKRWTNWLSGKNWTFLV